MLLESSAGVSPVLSPPPNGENNQCSSVSEPRGSVEIFLGYVCRLHLGLRRAHRGLSTGPAWEQKSGYTNRSLLSFTVSITSVSRQGYTRQRTSLPDRSRAPPGPLLLRSPSCLHALSPLILSSVYCQFLSIPASFPPHSRPCRLNP